MKHIRKLNSILFDVAGIGIIMTIFLPFAIVAIVIIVIWAITLIIKVRKKPLIIRAEEQKQINIKRGSRYDENE